MYAFTAIDPDFKPKGSRDPLGFQPIWSEVGRKLIKDLSTVSNNINDFKILCFAKYFFHEIKNEEDERLFLPFFLRIEQAFAYARRKYNNEQSFNGSIFISKSFMNEQYTISNDQKDCILSNQRTYGIYGKYVRPSRDMKLFDHENFLLTFKQAFNSEVIYLFEKIYQNRKLEIPANDLKPFAELLESLTKEERIFFKETILLGNNKEHIQQIFYHFLKENPEWSKISSFNLFDYLNGVITTNFDEELTKIIEEIKYTEKVLALMNYNFTHLLSKRVWLLEDINQDEILSHRNKSLSYNFKSETVNDLNNKLSFSGSDAVDILIERNASVSKRRNGSQWIKKENLKYIVYYGDTNRDLSEMDENYWENSYYIQTYIGLFNVIEQIN